MIGDSPCLNEFSRRYWWHYFLLACLARLPVATPWRAQARTSSRAAKRSRTRRGKSATDLPERGPRVGMNVYEGSGKARRKPAKAERNAMKMIFLTASALSLA